MKNKTFYLLVLLLLLGAYSCSPLSEDSSTDDKLSAWNHNGSIYKRIINFIDTVCSTLPPEDRIAVFDMDGTIACEWPVSMESSCIYTSAFPSDTIINRDSLHIFTKNDTLTLKQLKNAIASKVNNRELQIEDYRLVDHFSQEVTTIYNRGIPVVNPVPRLLINQFYKPMVQLINYLQNNGFKVYIVSGSAQEFIWAAVKNRPELNIDSTHIIGSVLDYYAVYDTLGGRGRTAFFAEGTLVGNVSKYKAINIHRVIGKTPILAFGNTVNDFDMFAYTSSNHDPTLCVLLNHDSKRYEACYKPYSPTDTFILKNWTGWKGSPSALWNSDSFNLIMQQHNWHIMNMSEVFIEDSIFF